jgi:hypothetical protein
MHESPHSQTQSLEHINLCKILGLFMCPKNFTFIHSHVHIKVHMHMIVILLAKHACGESLTYLSHCVFLLQNRKFENVDPLIDYAK